MDIRRKKNKPSALFAVKLQEMVDGSVIIEKEIPLNWLADRLKHCEYEVLPESARLAVKLQAAGGGVWVKGEVAARINTYCGMCLASTSLEFTGKVNTLLLPASEMEKYMHEDQELTPEDLEKESFDGEWLILDDLISDAIMLELPMNPKCGDACPGYLAEGEAGNKEERIDPRFAVLANIKIDKEK